MRDWRRSDELRSLAPLADLSRSYELIIFFESRSDRLSDVEELSPTVLLGAAPTYSAPDARTSGVFLAFQPCTFQKPLQGCLSEVPVHPACITSGFPSCSRVTGLGSSPERPGPETHKGPGEKTRQHTTKFQTVGKAKEYPWRAAQGAALLWTSVPLALAHHVAGRTPEFDGTQKWSLATSEEPGKGDLDEVVVAPVPEYM